MSSSITVTRKRQSLNPTQSAITRTPHGSSLRFSMGGPSSTTYIRRSNVQATHAAQPLLPAGQVSTLSKQSVAGVVAEKHRDKKNLSELNDKFAKYIENVKYLEAQNQCMQEELENLRKLKGYTQDSVRSIYEEELAHAREVIANQAKEIAPLNAEKVSLMDKIETLEEQLTAMNNNNKELMKAKKQLNSMIGDLEGENKSLRGQLESTEQDMDMLEAELERTKQDNDRIRGDYEEAVVKQINAENERDALRAELEFVNEAFNAEIAELTELLANFKSMQPDMQKHWKSNFQEMCRTLKDEYERRQGIVEQDLQSRYDEQLRIIRSNINRDDTDSQIVKSENKTLKSQFGAVKGDLQNLKDENDRLRAALNSLQIKFDDECDECEKEKNRLRADFQEKSDELDDVRLALEELRSSKLNLELEIACYRKLLESEENSMKSVIESQTRMQSSGGSALAGIISGGMGGGGSMSGGGSSSGGGQSVSQQSSMSESTGTVKITRKTKCNVNIAECALDGSYIRLENSSTKSSMDLGNWVLQKSGPKFTKQNPAPFYKFSNNFKLGSGKSVKIFSNNNELERESDSDLVAPRDTCRSWGTGDGFVLLKDPENAEKAECNITFAKQ